MISLRSFTRDASLFTLTSFVSTALSGALGLIVARVLDPNVYGTWLVMRTVVQFSAYGNLGVPWTMQQDVAAELESEGKGRGQQAMDVSFTFVSVTSLMMSATLVAISVATAWPFGPLLGVLLALSIATSQLYALSFGLLTARRQFLRAGLVDISTSAINVLLTVPLVYMYRLPGLLAGQIAWSLLGFVIIHARSGVPYRWLADYRDAIKRIRVGIQFTLNGFLILMYRSVDRFVILATLGTAALGRYGIGLLAAGYFELLGASVGRALFTHAVAAYERRREMSDIRVAVTSSTTLGLLVPAAAGVAALVILPVVHFMLPRYDAGIPAAQVLVMGSAPVMFRYTMSFVLATLSRLSRIFPAYVIAVAAVLAIALPGIALGFGIVAVAVADVMANLLVSVYLLTYAFWQLDPGIGVLARFLVSTHLPSLYAGGCVLAVEVIIPPGHTVGIGMIEATLLQSVAFLALCLPLLVQANRLHGFVNVSGLRKMFPGI